MGTDQHPVLILLFPPHPCLRHHQLLSRASIPTLLPYAKPCRRLPLVDPAPGTQIALPPTQGTAPRDARTFNTPRADVKKKCKSKNHCSIRGRAYLRSALPIMGACNMLGVALPCFAGNSLGKTNERKILFNELLRKDRKRNRQSIRPGSIAWRPVTGRSD